MNGREGEWWSKKLVEKRLLEMQNGREGEWWGKKLVEKRNKEGKWWRRRLVERETGRVRNE